MVIYYTQGGGDLLQHDITTPWAPVGAKNVFIPRMCFSLSLMGWSPHPTYTRHSAIIALSFVNTVNTAEYRILSVWVTKPPTLVFPEHGARHNNLSPIYVSTLHYQ